MAVVWLSRTFDHEQRIGCELPTSNCADITGSLHVTFCRATSARYNNGRPPACWIAICWLQAMVVKARSEKIYCEPFFKETCLFSSSLLEMVCNYELHLTMCIYGNLAYPLRVHLQTPFRRVPLTPLMQDYNEAMSALRICVECYSVTSLILLNFLIIKRIWR